MGQKIIKLTENDLKNIVKRVIQEQDENYKGNITIQCFLNKKGIKDDSGQALKLDGSIGRLPNSKSAQAIANYQSKLGVEPDGVWGYDTGQKMSSADKAIFKQCASDHGDFIDKAMHLLGID
jgi:peptidoglycan hydrolase-like protein with peptidoglycan-binding domain